MYLHYPVFSLLGVDYLALVNGGWYHVQWPGGTLLSQTSL